MKQISLTDLYLPCVDVSINACRNKHLAIKYDLLLTRDYCI